MGLKSRWYHQHRSPDATEPPEQDETRVPPCPSQVKVQFHLVQRRADPHDRLKAKRHWVMTAWHPELIPFREGQEGLTHPGRRQPRRPRRTIVEARVRPVAPGARPPVGG